MAASSSRHKSVRIRKAEISKSCPPRGKLSREVMCSVNGAMSKTDTAPAINHCASIFETRSGALFLRIDRVPGVACSPDVGLRFHRVRCKKPANGIIESTGNKSRRNLQRITHHQRTMESSQERAEARNGPRGSKCAPLTALKHVLCAYLNLFDQFIILYLA